MRWVVYVDIDAYYVSCELRTRPELVGQPVIVGPDPRLGPTRGVVLSASYEARSFGVRSALPVGRALALCPSAVWLPADFPKYESIAGEVRAFLGGFGGRVVPLSIDEAAVELDLDGPDEAGAKAQEVQAGLLRTLGLPSSLGVATHRTVAKIASDRAKPGGIVVVTPERLREFLAPLPVRTVPGVGPKTAERLAAVGVSTIGDLATVPTLVLRRAVGGFAHELLELAAGTPRPEVDREGPRSRSAAETFLNDVRDEALLARTTETLAKRLAESVATERLRFQTVSVSARWADFAHSRHGRRLPQRTDDAVTLALVAGRLLKELLREEARGRGRAVRTLSVGVAQLSEESVRDRPLEAFEAEGTVKSSMPRPRAELE